jgi:hypothetical protein
MSEQGSSSQLQPQTPHWRRDSKRIPLGFGAGVGAGELGTSDSDGAPAIRR